MTKNNEQRLMRLGAIQEKKQKLAVLDVQIERLAKDLGIAVFMDDGVESIDIVAARVHFTELCNKIEKYNALKQEIIRLENV